MMHGIITFSPVYNYTDENLIIGTLPSITTFGNDRTQTNQNARNLQIAARDAYFSQVINGLFEMVGSRF